MKEDTPGDASDLAAPRARGGTGAALTVAALTASIVAAVHWPVLSARAIAFDDRDYVVNNRLVQTPGWASIRRFFGEVLHPSTVQGYYQPLTMVSLMLDCAAGGGRKDFRPFHRTSLALHAINVGLVVLVLWQLFGAPRIAGAAGLLFGLHPMTVEPLAWLGERKTLLATLFSLLCVVTYLRFVRSRDRPAYAGCVATYALALLSKPTSTPVVLILLLLDWWPLGRLNRRAVVEKIPLFIIAAVSAAVTFVSQKQAGGASMPGEHPPWEAPLIVCHNIVFYLRKIMWPVNLSPHYRYPEPLSPDHPAVLAGLIGTIMLLALLAVSLRRTRALAAGWLIFFVGLLPAIGIIRISNVIAADKYAYLPMIGLTLLVAHGLTRFWNASRDRPSRRALIAVLVCLLAATEARASRRQIAHWRDTLTLFSRMEAIDPAAPMVQWSLGNEWMERGETARAIAAYEQALRLRPDYGDAHNNLGVALRTLGRVEAAIEHYREAIRLAPRKPYAYVNLGNELADAGKADEAMALYRQALRLKPGYADAHNSLGTVLRSRGLVDEAIEHYRAAITAEPWQPAPHVNYGNALRQKGDLSGAREQYEQAIRLDPDRADAHLFLGTLHLDQKRYEDALVNLRTVLRIDPRRAEAHYFRGRALEELGRRVEAQAAYEEALRIKPDLVTAKEILERLGSR